MLLDFAVIVIYFSSTNYEPAVHYYQFANNYSFSKSLRREESVLTTCVCFGFLRLHLRTQASICHGFFSGRGLPPVFLLWWVYWPRILSTFIYWKISLFHLLFFFAEYRILIRQDLFQHLRILSLSSFGSRVLGERSAGLAIVLLHITCIFHWLLFRLFLCLHFHQFGHDMPSCGFLWIYHIWHLLSFLSWWIFSSNLEHFQPH